MSTSEEDEMALGNPNAERNAFWSATARWNNTFPECASLLSKRAIDLNRNRIIFDVHGGCPPIPDIARDRNPACAPFVDKVLRTLDGDKVKTVAFTACWTTEFTDAEYYLRSDPSKVLLRDSEAAQDRALGNFAALISHLVDAGKRVFVLLETPSSNIYDPVNSDADRMASFARSAENSGKPDTVANGEIRREDQRQNSARGGDGRRAGDQAVGLSVRQAKFCPIVDKDGRLMYYRLRSPSRVPTFAIMRPTSIRYFARM